MLVSSLVVNARLAKRIIVSLVRGSWMMFPVLVRIQKGKCKQAKVQASFQASKDLNPPVFRVLPPLLSVGGGEGNSHARFETKLRRALSEKKRRIALDEYAYWRLGVLVYPWSLSDPIMRGQIFAKSGIFKLHKSPTSYKP